MVGTLLCSLRWKWSCSVRYRLVRCMEVFADLGLYQWDWQRFLWNRYDEALVYVDKFFHPRPMHVKAHKPLVMQFWNIWETVSMLSSFGKHTRKLDYMRRELAKSFNGSMWNLHSVVPVNRTQLVDPASVYMLVSKTKPCMSKYSIVEQSTLRNRGRLIKSVVV